MKNKIKSIWILALILGLSFNLKAQTKNSSTKVYAVQFHADWCGLCKTIEPKIAELKVKAKNDDVEFLKVDLTNSATKSKSRATLDKLGIAEHFDNNNGTAFVLLVDAESGESITKLFRGHSSDEMYEILKESL